VPSTVVRHGAVVLVDHHVKKVVIGILDPNQGVCGKGVLQLQEANIEVELFPHEMAKRIVVLNQDFIHAQKDYDIEITYPKHDTDVPLSNYPKTGCNPRKIQDLRAFSDSYLVLKSQPKSFLRALGLGDRSQKMNCTR